MTSPTPGEVLFARYAYPPNQLGYCGPEGADVLLDAAAGHEGAIRDRAAEFDGAWAYLETIAAATGLDPMDHRVVQAYWVGNELLDRVDSTRFGQDIRTRFAGETGADWQVLDTRSRTGSTPRAVPHHSFQVFTVYPWVRLLDRGDTALRVLDRCRIRDGKVLAVAGDDVVVRSRPLQWDGGSLSLGTAVEERARWAQGGRSLLSAVAPGDRVALHWDWVCDRLTDTEVADLRRRTTAQLDLTNAARAIHPGAGRAASP